VRTGRLGTQQIQAGDMLVVGVAAANADPEVRRDLGAGTGGKHERPSSSWLPGRPGQVTGIRSAMRQPASVRMRVTSLVAGLPASRWASTVPWASTKS